MRFEQQLALIVVPSWAKYYLDYKKLKSLLNSEANAVKELNGRNHGQVYLPNNHSQIEFSDDASNANMVLFKEFTTMFLSEIEKVDAHYENQLSQGQRQLESLSSKWHADMPANDLASWKSDFHELVQQLENLTDFTKVSITSCRKILEKASRSTKLPFMSKLWPKVDSLPFAKSEADEALLNQARAVWRRCTAVSLSQLVVNADTAAAMNPKVRTIASDVPTVTGLDLNMFPVGKISRVWIALAEDGLGMPIRVPVIVARGSVAGPVVGITSALHGNELNGIPLIHRLFREISPNTLHGTVIAVPVLNTPGFLMSQRGYTDGTDLNRRMPGKINGSSPQVYTYNIIYRIVCHFEYLIDLHTASSGRVNSLYVRADMLNPKAARMARLQNPQIIVHNSNPGGSLRGAAVERGIPAITVEIGDPSRFHKRFIKNALLGVTNILSHLCMIPNEEADPEYEPVLCTRSFWIFAKSGGILNVIPDIATWVRAGDLIATVHSIFGDLIEEYFAPQDGVIVGKHVDPVCQTGNRILHLGVVEDTLAQVADDGHL
ncbi:hypothetical protein IW140_001110 [Coemansia sp. RSA 1813]|nr:hypothetical protein EV178_002336 [Coemansia sp. RSA 1646]KAJ1773141.1 hypothetical protein LPJ74_000880 [Coemansia sp. RSA 1843]KAJ2092019.1 hypothetical protein IW138_001385 [Coemansia sp. RSA 986]KAJ2216645.1 hypothetical protein EV179_001184 [Coemansia sp. RSA 487]KAJ2572070.1 hypothetical protein IW140_001110 [Coemansia sp. RSA 1813]